MRRMMVRLLVSGVIFVCCFSSCLSDAPPFNPNDPQLTGSSRIKISGRVVEEISRLPVAAASILIIPENSTVSIATVTDNDGMYMIEEVLASGNYAVLCSADSYATDSLQVSLEGGGDILVDFFLNALPNFSRISLTTVQEKNFIPPNEFYIDIEAETVDPDGFLDVELVWCTVSALGFTDTLIWSPGEQHFATRLRPADFGVSSIQEVIGRQFDFHVRDRSNDVFTQQGIQISRIIEPSPETIAPFLTAIFPISFSWINADINNVIAYPFTYTIEIYQDTEVALPPEVVIADISADSLVFTYVGGPLQTGADYYWTLYIVDEFGNKSRSAPKPFTIQ